MEPQAPSTAVSRVLLGSINASDRPLFPKIDTARAASSPLKCSRPSDLFASLVPLSAMDRITAPRLYDSSVGYLDCTPMPPPRSGPYKPRPSPSSSTPRRSNNEASLPTRDEFLILHPSLDLSDATGELSQLLLSKWSLDTGQDRFASISLFCEMKLSEAKRMTSWVERPNRFFATVVCQLLDKYVRRLEAQQHAPESGASAAFLRKVHDELVAAIFINAVPNGDYAACVPFFLEYKKLKRHAQVLLANVENREQVAATKETLPHKLDKLLATHRTHTSHQLLLTTFRAWRATAHQAEMTRTLKCRAFRASRKLNLSALFRAWRIEALRRAYQRESVEYQTMLSITAASLSRKDVQIAEAESKMASMAKIIDSLTESNAQLLYRVEQLEAIASGKGGGTLASLQIGRNGPVDLTFLSRSPDIDSTTDKPTTTPSADDEKSDRTNRMLLETLFGMARMVESCAIQMSKDVMDSLEHQLDGSMLQQLAEQIHADNVVQIQADEARGRLGMSVSPPVTPSQGASRLPPTSVAFSNTTMLASLGKGAVAIKDLALMPVDAFLLQWFKMNLQMSSAAEKTTDRTIKNFTSDLKDGRRFSFLLHRLFPAWFDANMVHEIDADERLKNIAGFHTRVQPVLPTVVTSDSIHSGSATENIAFTAMLFGLSVHSIRRINLDRQREKFLSIITSWKRVRSLLLEVKRMNDNYDGLMVVHLLKEMRTCETLFKQLNADLGTIAIASNESASTFSQISYKLLQLTWRCLHEKLEGNGVHTLNLVDERLAERVKDFAHVEAATVRQLMVNDSHYEVARPVKGGSMPPQAVTEKDVGTRTEAVRDALVAYCKDLHDIFKHYSASGGGGSIASMSLSEFFKFVKDCGLLPSSDATAPPSSSNKHAPVAVSLTPSMVEYIFHASLFFSPLTPREVITTVLANASSNDPPATASNRNDALNLTSGVLPRADPLRPESVVTSLDWGEREMIGHEFVDALVRLAAIKNVVFGTKSASLDDRFRDLMETYVVPNALRSQSEIFRAEVASPKVRAVFQKHKPVLQRIFRYYTSMHALREQQSTMDLKEFLIFARDCKLIGSFVTEHTLKQVLVNLQRDDAVAAASESATPFDDAAVLRVDFSDFQEALAALTEYVICNPYVPLYKRVEQFVNEHVVPRARQKKKGAGEFV